MWWLLVIRDFITNLYYLLSLCIVKHHFSIGCTLAWPNRVSEQLQCCQGTWVGRYTLWNMAPAITIFVPSQNTQWLLLSLLLSFIIIQVVISPPSWFPKYILFTLFTIENNEVTQYFLSYRYWRKLITIRLLLLREKLVVASQLRSPSLSLMRLQTNIATVILWSLSLARLLQPHWHAGFAGKEAGSLENWLATR